MISPTLQDIEMQRRSLQDRKQARTFVVIFSISVFVLINIALIFYYPQFIFVLAFGEYILLFLLYDNFDQEYKKFRHDFKNSIVRAVIAYFNSEASYYPKEYLAPHIFEESRIFPVDYTSFVGEDLIACKNLGNLQLSEISVGKLSVFSNLVVAGLKLDESTKIMYFVGLFGSFNVLKNFAGTVVIYPKGSKHQGFDGPKLNFDYQQSFNKVFEVRSDNENKARDILDSRLIDQIMQLQAKAGFRIWLSLSGNQVFFGIEDQSFLEPSLELSVIEQPFVTRLQEELKIINDIVQIFKLGQS